MKVGEPCDTDAFRGKLKHFAQTRKVMQQIAVRHHYAAGSCGGTRSVLQKPQRIEIRGSNIRVVRGIRQIVRRKPCEQLQLRRSLEPVSYTHLTLPTIYS